MNNKLKNLILIILTFLFVILLLNIFNKRIEKNNSDITNMQILNYVPSNYDLTILSNSTNNNERTTVINFLSLISIFYFYS